MYWEREEKFKGMKTGNEDVTLFINRWYDPIYIEISSNFAIRLNHSILLRCQFSLNLSADSKQPQSKFQLIFCVGMYNIFIEM